VVHDSYHDQSMLLILCMPVWRESVRFSFKDFFQQSKNNKRIVLWLLLSWIPSFIFYIFSVWFKVRSSHTLQLEPANFTHYFDFCILNCCAVLLLYLMETSFCDLRFPSSLLYNSSPNLILLVNIFSLKQGIQCCLIFQFF
jgi:uncharacterized membrane protein